MNVPPPAFSDAQFPEHTILVVDDNPTNLKVLSECLGKFGYRVLVARDGSSALEKAQYHSPDLILLDIMMPGMDGFETCQHLKASPDLSDIPVIFMTALDDPGSKMLGFQVGGVDYITKPFQPEELQARVRVHLDLRHIRRQLEAQNIRLHETHLELEQRVQVRTAELAQANQSLKTEIAERKLAEERWRRLVDTATEGVWVLGEDLCTTFVNARMAEMLGADAADLIGRPYASFMLEEDRPIYAAQMVARRQGITGHYESRFLRTDGRIIWALVSASPLMGPEGQFQGSFAMLADITERKAIEEAMFASEARYRFLYNDNPSMYFTLDASGLVLSVNQFGAEQLGYTVEQLVGQSILNVLHPADQGLATQQLQECLRTPEKIFHWELRKTRKDGHLIWVKETARAVRRSDGQAVVLVVCEDITEQRWAEKVRQALHAVVVAVLEAGNEDSLIQRVTAIVGETLPADNFGVLLLEAENVLQYHASYHGLPSELIKNSLPQEKSASRQVACLGQTLRIQDSHYKSNETSMDPAIRAQLCTPLKIGERVIGVINLESVQAEAFTQADERLLETVAGQLATAIEKLRLFEQTRRHLERLNALHAIDKAITANLNLQITLDVLLEQVLQQLGVDAVDILLLDWNTQTLQYAAGSGFRHLPLGGKPHSISEGFAGQVVAERSPLWIACIEEYRQRAAPLLPPESEGFVAYYGMPLISKGQIKGVLEIYQRQPLTLEPDRLDFLEALVSQAAIAIDNTSLFDALQRSNQELSVAYNATLEGWARALELRDAETEGHSRRVTALTLRLARVVGIKDADLIHVQRGALLHDIGKMGIPDSILQKPGPLSAEERAIMQKHPEYAFKMLHPIVYLRPALDIPYRHHERWDGTGYPHGLQGEKIPLPARIFALVDVWDALNSDRPYRKAWPRQAILRHIAAQSGLHFDPQLTEILLRLVQNE